jgi:hypothetical protein
MLSCLLFTVQTTLEYMILVLHLSKYNTLSQMLRPSYCPNSCKLFQNFALTKNDTIWFVLCPIFDLMHECILFGLARTDLTGFLM